MRAPVTAPVVSLTAYTHRVDADAAARLAEPPPGHVAEVYETDDHAFAVRFVATATPASRAATRTGVTPLPPSAPTSTDV